MREIALSLIFFILITLAVLYIWLLHRKIRFWHKSFIKIKNECLELNSSNLLLKKRVCKAQNRFIKEKRAELFLKGRFANRLKSGLMIVGNELERYSETGDESYLTRIRAELTILIHNSSSLLQSYRKGAILKKDSPKIVFNLSQLINKIVDQYRDTAKLKSTWLRSSLEENIFIKEEPSIIVTIVNNLLSNALKFTGLAPGKRERLVKVTLKSSIEGLLITIIDNGPGFAAAPESNGLRLGLQITKNAIKSIGGRLSIMSRPGKGTECSILLPQTPEQQSNIESVTPPVSTSYLNPVDLNRLPELYPHKEGRHNILVVSLEEGLIRLIADYLHRDFNIEQAMTPLTAIEIVRAPRNIDLIILDLPLQIAGIKTLLQIVAKESPKTVLAITNSLEKNIELNKTVTDLKTIIYADKPFNIEELQRKLKAFFQNNRIMPTQAISSNLNRDTFNLDLFAESKSLTSREKDILRYIIEGKTLKETSRALAISIETVKKYRQKLFSKLEVKSAREIFPKYFR